MLPVKKLQNAETQYRACQKEAAQAKADYQELLGGAAAAEQIAVHTAKEIEQAEKELGACMEKAGILVMEKAGEEYSACTQKIKEQEEQLLQDRGTAFTGGSTAFKGPDSSRHPAVRGLNC